MKQPPLRLLLASLMLVILFPAFASDRSFTQEELATFHGRDGQPAYVAVEGIVYDVTDSPRWRGGRHNGYEAGADLTEAIIGRSPHGKSIMSQMPVVGTLQGYTPSQEEPAGSSRLYSLLGMASVLLFIVVTSPYWVRTLNTKFFHIKGPRYTGTLKVLRVLHKPAGLLLLLIAAIHGYLALGTPRIHSGQLAWLAFGVTAVLGIIFYIKKKPALLKAHRKAALAAAILVAIHLIVPNILGFAA